MNKYKSLVFILLLFIACSKEEHEFTGDNDISIMSFNLRSAKGEDSDNKWADRKDACVKMIKETKPSIWGIQEGLLSQLNFLEDNLEEYNYFGKGRDDGESLGEFNAVFYLEDRFELLEGDIFWLSETPDEPSYGWDAVGRCIATWAHLKDLDSDKTLFFVNTHFDHIGMKAREESAKLLVRKIKEIVSDDATVFITGDFNTFIGSSMLKPILKEYNSARKSAEQTDDTKSFNSFGGFFSWNIDFIFYKNAKALTFRTVSEDFGVKYISDHYPIISHFKY